MITRLEFLIGRLQNSQPPTCQACMKLLIFIVVVIYQVSIARWPCSVLIDKGGKQGVWIVQQGTRRTILFYFTCKNKHNQNPKLNLHLVSQKNFKLFKLKMWSSEPSHWTSNTSQIAVKSFRTASAAVTLTQILHWHYWAWNWCVPASSTKTLLLSMTVGILWAILMTVESSNSCRMIVCMTASVSASTEAVASSRTRIRLCLSRTRPRQKSCLCPRLQFSPFSKTAHFPHLLLSDTNPWLLQFPLSRPSPHTLGLYSHYSTTQKHHTPCSKSPHHLKSGASLIPGSNLTGTARSV